MLKYPILNQIGIEKEPRGTETSKYPEEEKETSIPSVAASERGRAETIMLAWWGYGLHLETEANWNGFGKAGQRG